MSITMCANELYSEHSCSSAMSTVDTKMCIVAKDNVITTELYSPLNSTSFSASEVLDYGKSSQNQCNHANELLQEAEVETRRTQNTEKSKKYHRCALIRLYQKLQEPEVNERINDRVEDFLDWIQSIFEGLSSWRIRSVLTEVTHLPNKERCAICLEDCIPEVIPTTVTPSSSTNKDHENNTDSNNSDTTHNSLPSITKKTAGKDKESSKRSHRIIAKSNDKTNNNNNSTTINSINSNVTNSSVRLSSNTTQDEKRNKNENTTENSDCSSSPSSSSSVSTKCVQIISCGHVFHKPCIKSWLRVKSTCPVCKLAASKKCVQKEKA